MARAAASAAVVRNALEDLDGTNVNVSRGTRDLSTNLDAAGESARSTSADIDGIGRSTQGAGREIDRLSGRLRLFTDLALTLGPGLIPIGTLAVPAVATLAAGLGAAALAAGAAVVAFQGVGDATKALDEYDLAPTAANLEKAQAAMAQLGPDAASFVTAFQEFQPVLTNIRDSAATGLFPGITESLENFERVGPRVASIFEEVGRASGEAVRDFSAELAGPRYADFLAFLETAAPEAISSMARTLGDVTHGVTELMQSLNPGIQGGFGWIEDVANGFDRWASSAKGRKDIESFLDYVRQTGPQVADLFGSLAGTFGALGQAAAPLGGPVLSALTGISEAIGAIASSPLGTPIVAAVSALALYNRSMIAAVALQTRFNAGALGGAAAGTAGAGGFAASAAGATALAVGIGHISDSMSVLDSTQRNSGAVKAVATDVDSLASALGESNVGKYAADLGIDIQRLSEDLIVNGSQGKYASEVLGQLGDASHGAGAALKEMGGTILPFYTASSTKAYDANKDLQSIIEGNAGSLNQSAAATGAYAGMTEQAAQAARDQAAAVQAAMIAIQAKTGTTLSAFDAETAYRQALAGARAAADASNAGIRGNTDAAIANRSAISGLAAAWNSQSEAVKNNSGRYKTARGDFIAAAQGMGVAAGKARQLADTMLQLPKRDLKIKAIAETAGATKSIAVFKDRLTSLPKNTKSKVTADTIQATRATQAAKNDLNALGRLRPKPRATLDAGALMRGSGLARGNLNQLGGMRPSPTANLNDNVTGPARGAAAAVNSIQSKTVTITTILRTIGTRAVAGGAAGGIGADGGIHGENRSYGNLGLRRFADGGGYDDTGRFFDRVPQVVTGGRNIMWAEPETGREAYISDKPGQRDRNLEVLKQAAGWFGANVTPMASGGTFNDRRGPGSLPGFGDFDRAANRAARSTDKMSDSQDRNRKRDDNSLKARIKAAEKEVEARKKVVEALKATRDEVVSSVRERFSSDLFAKPESQSVLPDDIATMDPVAARAYFAIQAKVDAGNNPSPADVLRRDIAGLGQFNNIRASLQGAGLKGAALSELLRNAPMEQLQAYASGPRSELRQFASLYTQRQQALGSVSGAAGNAVVPELKRALRESQESNRHLRELNQAMKRQEKRDEDAPRKIGKATGDAVGDKINNAAVAGRRRTAGP